MRHFIFLLLLIPSLTINAQLKGKILNIETQEPIPYANIAIENTIFGTTSNFNGSFQFTEVPAEKRLVISSVGFETQYLSVSDTVVEIFLHPKTYDIDLVTVKPSNIHIKTRVNEIPSRNSSNHLFCNGYPWMSARYFEYKAVYQNCPFINEIRVLTHSQIEGSKFNIRIISANDKGEPSEEIISENIIVSTPKGNHIVTVDLAYLNLIFPENGLFVALEWLIIDENKRNHIYKMKGEKERRHEIRYDPRFGAFPIQGRVVIWSYSGGRWLKSSFEDHLHPGKNLDLAIEVVLSE